MKKEEESFDIQGMRETNKSNKRIYYLELYHMDANSIHIYSEDGHDDKDNCIDDYSFCDFSEDIHFLDGVQLNIDKRELSELKSFMKNNFDEYGENWDRVMKYCEDNKVEILE